MTSNTPMGQVYGAMGQVVRNKGANVVYSGSKALAEAALGRLERRYGVGGMNPRSAFEVDALKSKL